jgi:hypothetical protein
MYALRQAADDGIGIAQLADYVVMDQIASGALEIIPPRIGRCRAELCTPFLLTLRAVHGDPQPHRLSCFGIPGLMNTSQDGRHCIDFHRCGAAFHIEHLAFALGCAVDFVRS